MRRNSTHDPCLLAGKIDVESRERVATPSNGGLRGLLLFHVLVIGLCLSCGCQSRSAHGKKAIDLPAVPDVPSVTAKLGGTAEPVFDTRNACEQIDIPDAMARAFRDRENRVHLIATHYVARAMVGPSLDQVKHDCRVIYRSPLDANPADFLDSNWIDSLFTEDGTRIAALLHTEYHGDEHPGMCGDLQNPNHSQNCSWTTVTYAASNDGGYTFREPTPPANLVASLPYPYDPNNHEGAQGYNSPTNILKIGEYYFSMLNVWREYRAQSYGPCLIRTSDLYNPSSWRGWDGTAFSIRFIDPYTDHESDPAKHVCYPIMPGTLDSLAIVEGTGTILADVYVEDNRYGQGSGLYITASRDLIHWSTPTLVISTDALLKSEPPGHWSYLYFSMLDPMSKDRNFATVTASPYIYYVRLDDDNGPYARVLFRRRMTISFNTK